MNRVQLWIVLGLISLFAMPLVAQAKTEAELRESFKQRYRTLMAFKDAGKIGEVHTGFVATTNPNHINDRLDPDDENSPTVGHIIAAENADRRELYNLIAKRNDVSAEQVARENAQRAFDKAKPDHYLRPAKRDWVQKKNLDEG